MLRDARGANLVEAAIVTPLILLLTCAIADFTMILWVWLALENGASQAMRYAVTGNQIGTSSREASIKAVMRQATPVLTIDDEAFAFSHLPEGGDDWTGGIGGPGDIGKVTVTYPFTPVTPLIRPLFAGGQVTFTVESAMKNEGRFE